jgi:hypothetical protein
MRALQTSASRWGICAINNTGKRLLPVASTGLGVTMENQILKLYYMVDSELFCRYDYNSHLTTCDPTFSFSSA